MATPSKNERLHALIALLNPSAAKQYAKDGTWGGPCPYVLSEPTPGTQFVRVTSEGGDILAGKGATVEAALTNLEEKLVALGLAKAQAPAAKGGAQ